MSSRNQTGSIGNLASNALDSAGQAIVNNTIAAINALFVNAPLGGANTDCGTVNNSAMVAPATPGSPMTVCSVTGHPGGPGADQHGTDCPKKHS